MRSIPVAVVILISSLNLAVALPAPTLPNLTYPEPGAFCGFMKPCDASEADKHADAVTRSEVPHSIATRN